MARLVATLAILSLVLTSAPSAAAANGGEREKVIFVHYRNAPDVELAARTQGSACPDPTTCTDYRWKGNKWTNGNVSYELNAPNGLPGAATAVSDAFSVWMDAVNSTGGHLSVSGGSGGTSCSVAGSGYGNDVNQICWRDLTSTYPNAIAVTFIWYSRATKAIVEADTVFNSGSGFSWSYDDPGACLTYDSCNTNTGTTGKYDIRDIGTHEFGHFLALFSDLYTAKDAELTMYGYGKTNEVKKDSLAKGDCLGITAAYGGTCQ